MDILTLMVAYGLTFGIVSYILLLGDSNFHRSGIIGRIRRFSLKTLTWMQTTLLPQAVQDSLGKCTNYILYQRNPCFQYFYVSIVLFVVLVYTTSVLPLALAVEVPPLVILASYLMPALCLVLFVVCCKSDPGVITMATLHRYTDAYAVDGRLYREGAVCRTCTFEKPARSKHCATCNHCVYRFDHHCTWLNNCVGGCNAHFFLSLLISLSLTTAFVSYSVGLTLRVFADNSGLLRASYVGRDGRLWPVTWRVAVQHLFMERPMPVFLMMSLALLGLLLAAFTSYHLYLAATNQTTNERYKQSRLIPENRQNSTTQHTTKGASDPKNSLSTKAVNRIKVKCLHDNVYNRGLVSNIFEILFPLCNR